MVGLIKAVDRFDPSLGHAFTAFAGATIEGEVKRFFRDTTWSVRVPRSAKELYATVTAAIDALSQRLGRSPSVDEIAQQLEVSAEDGYPLRAAKSRVWMERFWLMLNWC